MIASDGDDGRATSSEEEVTGANTNGTIKLKTHPLTNSSIYHTGSRTLLNPLSHADWNKLVKIQNGNINKKFINNTDICFQNIPGVKSVLDVQIALDILTWMLP